MAIVYPISDWLAKKQSRILNLGWKFMVGCRKTVDILRKSGK
jgi:hypothetical protein